MMPSRLKMSDLAPCGIDCAACYARLRKRDPCPGCLSRKAGKPAHCGQCRIKACSAERGIARCYSCPDFPCAPVKRMDKRYRTGYGVGLIANGIAAQDGGLRAFMVAERERWLCARCAGIVDQHRRVCSECGHLFPLGGSCRRPGRQQGEAAMDFIARRRKKEER